MKIVNDYYVIEPGDSLEEIKYLMNLGCKVVGYFKFMGRLDIWRLFYNRFGQEIDKLNFEDCTEYNILDHSYFFVKW